MSRIRSFQIPCLVLRGFVLVALAHGTVCSGADWRQFRGPDGSGNIVETVPTQWNAKKNLLWKVKLPGPGASSPITLGDRVYVTSYTGFGTMTDDGKKEDLQRQLVCLNQHDGTHIWTTDLKSKTPEANYSGYMTQHGYASSTPATDGERIYVFLGTGGVAAIDLAGKEMWRQSVGTGTDGWGSGSSVVLFDSLVIVNASIESKSIVALDKTDGHEVWRFSGINRSWGTPALVSTEAGGHELVVSSQNKIDGLDPKTGKGLWFCEGISDYICPSVIAGRGVAHVCGGRNSQFIAVRTGGSGDVNASHVAWRERIGGNVPTPVLHEDRLFGINDRDGIAYCISAKTGNKIYAERLASAKPAAQPVAFQQGGRRGRGSRGGGGGGGGAQFYASLIAAGDNIYAVSRAGGVFVIAGDPKFKLLALNKLEGDETNFDATPAVSEGRLYLRSNEHLYCIGKE
ncbi:MAG: serine/threonine protein kinase [Planctomycetaceae bacterium]|nr:serine/threonine protein kinase [Planctomycetaceae bacterium]